MVSFFRGRAARLGHFQRISTIIYNTIEQKSDCAVAYIPPAPLSFYRTELLGPHLLPQTSACALHTYQKTLPTTMDAPEPETTPFDAVSLHTNRLMRVSQ